MFLSVTPQVAAQRGGFGAERYESSEMQDRVRKLFDRIGQEVGYAKWRNVDAGGSMEDVEAELLSLAEKVCIAGRDQLPRPVGQLWK